MLQRSCRSEDIELVRRSQVTLQAIAAVDIADLPTGHRKRLAGGVDRKRALPHIRQRGDWGMRQAIEGYAFVDLVCEHDDIVGFTKIGNEGQFVAVKYLSCRVVRGIKQE